MPYSRYKNAIVVGTDEARGLRAIIIPEDSHYVENPREWCNLGTLALSKRSGRYFPKGDTVFEGEPEPDAVVSFAVYGYAHGNVSISTHQFSCPWDSGLIGCYSISARQWKQNSGKEWSPEDEPKAREIVEGELRDLTFYANGEVYGFAVERLEGDEWEEVDACFGYLGSETAEGMALEALGMAQKKI